VLSIEGVAVAAITPRRERSSEIDLAAALEVIDFISAHKVKAMALLGSTGEFVHFDLEQRMRLVSFAVKRSRVPVIANVSHSTLDGAIELARSAISSGAVALLVAPPYYFRYSQPDLCRFYIEFSKAFDSRTPLFLYNIPAFSNAMEIDTALELLSSGRFAGIKDSSGDWDYLEKLRAAASEKGFTLLIGNDAVFTRGRTAGAAGVVSGVACAVPELMLTLDRAITSGDTVLRQRLDGRLVEFLARLDDLPAPVGIKAACSARRIKAGPFALPLTPEAANRVAELQEWFRGWLPEVQKDCGA
jgi:4-hydroxy-tetrahydrodipicolinate synthase